MDTVIGIDLGTTNSEIAVLIEGKSHIIPVDGELIMPSCVGISSKNELLVGHSARNQMIVAPDSTIVSIKRKMGTQARIRLNEKSFSPEEISALILRKLKKTAEAHLGHPVEKAVITVPAYFDDAQRKATRNAGILAGLEVMRIINEPTAAALAYDADLKKNQMVLVYDLGGGTFDVSLVNVENGVVEVKASHGDTQLGGDDFDHLLMEWVAERFFKQTGIDLLSNPMTKYRLWQAVESAKRSLSDAPYAYIREEFICDDLHLDLELSRREYEEMIRPLIRRTLDSVHHCLKDAQCLPKEIERVILVGGASRTPLIAEMIRDELDVPPCFEINPDLIVAIGAAIQAGAIAGQSVSSVLVDITPHSVGTNIVDLYEGEYRPGIFCPVIQRNTSLPVQKSEAFYTMVDGQKSVDVQIYQGESSLVQDNTFIGNFIIEGLSNVPAGNELILKLDLDLNGILEVTAEEKRTGMSKTVHMETGNDSSEVDMEAAQQNLTAFLLQNDTNASNDDSKQDSVKVKLYNDSERLAQRAAALLSEVASEDADELKELMTQSEQAKKDEDLPHLAQLNETLSDILYYLED